MFVSIIKYLTLSLLMLLSNILISQEDCCEQIPDIQTAVELLISKNVCDSAAINSIVINPNGSITIANNCGSRTSNIPTQILPAVSLANIESDNNVSEGAFSRTGSVGTSLRYAREDHQHQIERLPKITHPTITAGGNVSIIQGNPYTNLYWSDEESIIFPYRIRTSQPAGFGWGWLLVPNIAGFQRPILLNHDAYINQSTSVQNDDAGGQGGNGASARGPVMDNMLSHWSFTQRLYHSYFRRDNAIASQFNTIIVKYIRASLLMSLMPDVQIISSEKDIDKLELFDVYYFDDFGLDLAPPGDEKDIDSKLKDLEKWFEITDVLQQKIEDKFSSSKVVEDPLSLRILEDLRKPNARSTIMGNYNVAELKRFAELNSIDISSAKNEPQIVDILLKWAKQ